MTFPHKIHWLHLGAEAVAASTAYMLVDLSDATNYHHVKTNGIHLCELQVGAEIHSGTFDLWFGVITEVDASNGTAQWFHVVHAEKKSTLNVMASFMVGGLNQQGLDLTIVAGAAVNHLSNVSLAGDTLFQNDTGLASVLGAAAGATGIPGAGDIVMYVEEVSTGTMDFSICTGYYTT